MVAGGLGVVASALHLAAARVAVAVDTSDCERVGDGLLSQPVNAVTSLAYVAAGAWVAGRGIAAAPARDPLAARRPLTFGALLALAGVGSVLYHGGDGEVSRWLHDVGFLWVLVFVAANDWPPVGCWDRHRRQAAAGVAALVAVAAIVPAATNGALVLLTVGLAWVEGRSWPGRGPSERRLLAATAAVLAVAVAVYLLTRTGAPLCDPESAVQGHGAWHVLTALAFVLWGEAAFRARRRGSARV